MRRRLHKKTWKSRIARTLLAKNNGRDPELVIERSCKELRRSLGKSEPPFQTGDYEYAALLNVRVIESPAIVPSGLLSYFKGRFVIEVKASDRLERKSYTVCHE